MLNINSTYQYFLSKSYEEKCVYVYLTQLEKQASLILTKKVEWGMGN